MGTWETGQMNTDTRCFDLLCFGKCDLNSTDIKLNVDSAARIPNFFTKNADGKIVVALPQPMMIVTTPKGHNTWVQIELKTINGKNISGLSELEKHVCLGIKKRSENDYFCTLNADNLSEYVDLFDWDALELVPLLSNAEGIIAPGDEIDPANFGLASADSFDFGSVYRVSLKNEGQLINRTINLKEISSSNWDNFGSMGVGSVLSEEGELLENRLVAVNLYGKFAYSSDGINWIEHGDVSREGDVTGEGFFWASGPAYGNGIWCVVCDGSAIGIRRSIDGGKTWSDTLANIGARCIAFGDGRFMTISGRTVYTSVNAVDWRSVGKIPVNDESFYDLIYSVVYGNRRWICCTDHGYVYGSETGEGEWLLLSEKLREKYYPGSWNWRGGCYANGDFYLLHSFYRSLMRSVDGVEWYDVVDEVGDAGVTYYKNKFYMVTSGGTSCYIYLPN